MEKERDNVGFGFSAIPSHLVWAAVTTPPSPQNEEVIPKK